MLGHWTLEDLLRLIGNLSIPPKPKALAAKQESRGNNTRKGPETRSCSECGEKGHLQYNCPLKNKSPDPMYSTFWIIDSGASFSLTSKLGELHDYVTSTEHVPLADGSTLEIEGRGKARIGNFIIEGVRYAVNAEHNLLSINDLTRHGLSVVFSKDSCKIESPQGAQLIALKNVSFGTLGHVNCDHILRLERRRLADGIAITKKEENIECTDCLQGKMTRTKQDSTARRIPEEPGDILSMDIIGPFPAGGMSSGKYISVIVDHFTGYTDIEILLHKDAFGITHHMSKFIAWLETQTKCKVKLIRTDKGNEYCNDNVRHLLEKKGIIHETTAPYSPASNGRVERQNRTILEGLKTCLLDSRLPKDYWSWAAYWTVFTQNRTLLGSHTGVTPYEGIYRHKPDISKLEPFGAQCFVLEEVKSGKLQLNSERGTFIGYGGFIRLWSEGNS